jgi:predicted ATPase/class 3 adenylate cyclase/DNA-binding CsgD family transcriptional regulator
LCDVPARANKDTTDMELSPALVARPFVVQAGGVTGDTGFVLPAGTVTFLLTDVEGSTRLWHDRAADMPAAIARHYAIIDEAIGAHGGVRPVEQGEGDSVVGAFARVSDAIAAAVQAQQQLLGELEWLPVRMAIHTGDAQLRDEGNYVGRTIIRCARLRACGHGRQILVSETSAALAGDSAPDGVSLVDLGSARLRDLGRAERVWQLAHADLPLEFPALRSLDAAPHNLPTPMTSFIGRDAELLAVIERISRHRIVTLAGSGGCGKTRLAQHAAADVVGLHLGGTWWVELAPVTTREQVAEQVASSVGFSVSPGTDPVGQIVRFLRDSGPTLVVLDNAEHVIDDVAHLVVSLAAGCPDVRVLVTSREPLGVPGEVVWRVPSLAVPSVEEPSTIARLETFEAVQLFLERARHARPNLVVDDAAAPAIAAICARLDGIPLALELAAARTRNLPLDRLAAGLDDSFRLLTGGARTVMARQQTLLASIAWSYDLLDEIERAVLRRLAVFAAPFTLDGAEAVAADSLVDVLDVLDTLGRLVDKSLVQLDDETGRYRLLETIRQFAFDRLRETDEIEATRARHCAYFVQWCQDVKAGRFGIDQRLLFPDVPDLLAAGRWARERDVDAALRMIDGLAWVRQSLGGSAETIKEYDFVLAFDRSHRSPLWATAASAAVQQSRMIGRFELYSQADEIRSFLDPDDTASLQRLEFQPALIAGFHGDFEPGESLFASVFDTANDWAVLTVAGMVAFLASAVGKREQTEQMVDQSRQLLKRHGLAFTPETAATAFAAHLRLLLSHCGFAEAQSMCAGQRPPNDGAYSSFISGTLAWIGWALNDIETVDRAISWMNRNVQPGSESLLTTALALRNDMQGAIDKCADQLDRMLADPSADTRAFRTMEVMPFYIGALLAVGRKDKARIETTTPIEVASFPKSGIVSRLTQCQVLLADGGDPTDLAHEALVRANSLGLTMFVIESLEFIAVGATQRGADVVAARIFGACDAYRMRTLYRSSLCLSWFDLDSLRAKAAESPAFAEGQGLSLEAVIEYAQRTRGERGRPTHGWPSLTPTELQVVDLIASGATNQQIADQLLMGVATVKTHLTHIFSKLGVSNRSGLAALATRRNT